MSEKWRSEIVRGAVGQSGGANGSGSAYIERAQPIRAFLSSNNPLSKSASPEATERTPWVREHKKMKGGEKDG